MVERKNYITVNKERNKISKGSDDVSKKYNTNKSAKLKPS